MNPNQLCQCNHIEKGMIFPRIRGGIIKLWTYGEIPCVNHPLNTSTVSWGKLLLGSGGWQVFPHAHSTNRLHHFTWARDSWTLPLSPSFWRIFTQRETLSSSSRTGFFLVFSFTQRTRGVASGHDNCVHVLLTDLWSAYMFSPVQEWESNFLFRFGTM